MELELQSLNLPGIDATRRPLVIAGPCSAETEEQVMTTALQLASNGIRIMRAGIWKPRTKPGGFEGVGEAGLPWLRRVREECGLLTATEVANAHHVKAALEYGIDILWIGARTSANPFAMQEIADALEGHDVPVLVKNPVNPDLELWIGALQRLNNAGIKRLAAVHRGFSSYDKRIYRNPPMWHIPIELRRRIPEIPMFGPTFANLGKLADENAIIITEGDYMGRLFFRDLYSRLALHIHECSFEEHDDTMAYSLSIPFVSTFVFAAVMKRPDAPGTTFKRHLAIAKGVLGEDEGLLREILFNPRTAGQVLKVGERLQELSAIIENRDEKALSGFLAEIRKRVLG